MSSEPRLDDVARLLGDRSRAAMLSALMDGRRWTGRELARAANVTPSTASFHLQQLLDGALIDVAAHGRHKYYHLARPEIASVLESLMTLAPVAVPRHAREIDVALRRFRTCYDHLAGQRAVELHEALIVRGAIRSHENEGAVTPSGARFFEKLGIPVGATDSRRAACRACLDWSERRYHLAGKLGTAIARHALESGWVVRHDGSRALRVTARGVDAFREAFGIDARDSGPESQPGPSLRS